MTQQTTVEGRGSKISTYVMGVYNWNLGGAQMAEKIASASKSVLGINDLKHVVDDSQECAVKWKPIGLRLGLRPSKLEEIAATTTDPGERLQKVLEEWLKKNTIPGSPDPSYYVLCDAVAKAGENTALAEKIAETHPVPDPAAVNRNVPDSDNESISSASGGYYTDDELNKLCSCGECSLQKIITEGCPGTGNESLHHFPLLDVQRLHQGKKHQYLYMIKKETIAINDAFDALCHDICKSLKSVSVIELKTHLKRMHWFDDTINPPTFYNKLERCEDIESVFSLLADICSWFNHHPLKPLVERFGSEVKKKYHDFVNNTLLPFLKRSITEIPKNCLGDVIEGSRVFRLKMNTKIAHENINADHIYFLKGSVAEALEISSEHLHVISFESGCIEVTFMVPLVIYEELFPLTGEHLQALQEIVVPIDGYQPLTVKSVHLSGNDQGKVLLQRYSEKLSQLVLSIEQVQLLYTEELISKEVLHDVERLGRVLSGSPLEELCTTVSKDLDMMRVLGSILLKSVSTVPLAYEILEEPDLQLQVMESALLNVSQSDVDKGNSCIHYEKSEKFNYSPGYLKDRYLSLIASIRSHIVAGLPFVSDVKTFLAHTFQEMRPQLAHAETADGIVTLVEENCSIDNVYCLESLVDHCDIQPAKALVEDYKVEVEEVFEEASTSDWLDVSFRSQSSRFILLKQNTMEIHLSNKFLKNSLKAIKSVVLKLFNDLANRLLMESIHQMTERSAICVKYSVPHHLIGVIQFEANKCLHELEQEGVVSLTIGHSEQANLLKENEALRKEILSLREKLSEQSIATDMERKKNYSRMLENQKIQEKFEAQQKIIEGKQHAVEKVFRGTVFHSLGPETVEVLEDAVIGVDKSGNIVFVGEGRRLELLKEKFNFRDWEIHQLKPSQFLMPGFVDTHIHPPQYPVAGAGFDKPLHVWLKKYIYPCEEQFADISFAREKYSEVVQHTLVNGTTTASYFATIHLESTKELCKVIAERKQRALVGKVNMDINSLSDYIEDTKTSIGETSDFIEFVEEMKNPLIQPVITPRTLHNCSRELLKQLAQIANEKCLHIQSILCQGHGEIDLALKSHHGYKSCTEILEKLELLTDQTYMAHCVHMSEEELLLLKERNVGIAHCPTANSIQRSGTMDARDRLSRGITIGLGTNIPGGVSLSILHAMRHAIQASNMLLIKAEENGQQYTPITLDEAFYMATLGGAQVLNLDDQIGNFKAGKQFDALIVDVKADHPLPLFQLQDKKDVLSKFIHNGDDRNIIKVFIAGHEVISK